MGQRTERGTLLGSIIAAGALCVAPSLVHAAAVSISSPSGTQGGQVTIVVSLASEGSAVAGAQNDITFDDETPVATKSSCLRTSTTTCTTDADCPLLDPAEPDKGREPCMVRPDCTGIATGKEVFFGCADTGCGSMRALVVSLGSLDPILDGPMYGCKVNIAGTATDGDKPVTLGRVILSEGDGDTICAPSGTPATCGTTNGTITVGPPAGATILVCDVAPSTGDTADLFGNDTINNSDVVAIFRASLLGPPPPTTDRAKAMDAVTVDAPPTCGGDGNIRNNDVVACFRRSLIPTEPKYQRMISGASCTSSQQ